MAIRVLGLKKIEIGPIAGDGGMGTVLSEIGDTVTGSCTFGEEEGTEQNFFVEEVDTAIETIESEPGVDFVDWATNNIDPDVMVKLFGGTKTTGPPLTYEPPATKAQIEVSLRVTDKRNLIIEYPRVKLRPVKAIAFNKTQLGQINIRATVLQPTKEDTAPYKITYPAP